MALNVAFVTMYSYLKIPKFPSGKPYGNYQKVDEETMQHLEEIIANANAAIEAADSLVALDEVRVQYLAKKVS